MRTVTKKYVFTLIFLACISYSFVIFSRYTRNDQCPTVNISGSTISNSYTEKPCVTLAVGILSKLSARSRRDSVRLSWFQVCQRHATSVVCRFFTDSIEDFNIDEKIKYIEEDNKYKDLIFMPYKGGHNFAQRLIWMLQWLTTRYNFEYFLRIDDDYFLCLDRLLSELPHRPKHGLYWGYVHCIEHVIRVDEGWMILSRDIIEEALSKLKTTLQCHPFGDQAVALWIQDSRLNVTYFSDKSRVIHAATAYQSEKFLVGNICSKYMALHGSYPLFMLKYWILSERVDKIQTVYEIPEIIPFDRLCKFKKGFDWRWFWPHVRYEPKLCKDNPIWGITNQTFEGRQDKGGEAIY